MVMSPNHGLTEVSRRILCAILAASIASLHATMAVHAEEGRAAVSAGALTIASDPVGANVFIDGRFAGRTPLSLGTVAPGDHRVRVVKVGYLENSRLVSVSAGQPRTVDVKLTKTSADDASEAAQVTGGGGGGGSKKWLWIGIAGGAAAGGLAYALTRNSAPTAGATSISPTGTGMAGQTTFTFSSTASDSDGDSLSYSWNFGDGSTGTGASPTKVFAAPGTYSVALTVSDGKKSATAPAATVTVGQNLTATWSGGRENFFGCAINWAIVQSGLNVTGSMVFVAPCTGTIPGVTGTVSALTHPATVSWASQPYPSLLVRTCSPIRTCLSLARRWRPVHTINGNLRLRQIPGTFDQSYPATYTR